MLLLGRGQLTLCMGWNGLPAQRLTASVMLGHFHDANQKGKPANKKMLKMKVAPNMLLKTKGSETTNPVLANMFMKAGSLQISQYVDENARDSVIRALEITSKTPRTPAFPISYRKQTACSMLGRVIPIFL
jgi:arginine/lysine/ornithine decarboxylase